MSVNAQTEESVIVTIRAPKNRVLNYQPAGDGRARLVALASYLQGLAGGCAQGSNRVDIEVSSQASNPVRASATIKLTAPAAGTVIEVGGVEFTAISGTAVAALNEFDISGTSAADAVALTAAINAATSLSGVLSAINNLKEILTAVSSIAGDTFKVTLANGVVYGFTAVAGAATLGAATFSIDSSDTATGTSIAAQINAYAPFAGKLTASSAAGVVTLRSIDGNLFTLVGTATTLAESGGTVVTVTANEEGLVGNTIVVKSHGVRAAGTVTALGVAAADTVTVNGTVLTAEQERATATATLVTAVAGNTLTLLGITFTGTAGAVTLGAGTFSIDTSDTAAAASLAAQINGHAALSGLVTATSVLGVVTIRAVNIGTTPNGYTLTKVGAPITVTGSGFLAGGLARSNNKFDVSPGATDAQVAAEIALCMNSSTTALCSGHVIAGVDGTTTTKVNIRARFDGVQGNQVTLASSDGTKLAVSGARLTGGLYANGEGAAAAGTIAISGGSGNYTCTINGVNASGTVAWNTSDTQTAADLADAINKSTNALVAGVIRATAATGTLTVTAVRGGVQGNSITFAGTGTGTTVSGARLTGGAAPTTATGPAGLYATGGVGGGGSISTSYAN